MRVLFLGHTDTANLSNGAARAINAVVPGCARVASLFPHPYGYEEDCVGAAAAMALDVSSLEWVVTIGDGDYQAFDSLVGMLGISNVRLATQHAGSAYRNHWERYEAQDARFELRFVGSDSFYRMKGDPRARVLLPSNDDIEPGDSELVVSHSPSKRDKKGTDAILAALRGTDLDLIEGVSHAECLRRRAGSQIFIDQLVPSIGGFGKSSVEAMAQGCAVLSDMRHICDEVFVHYERPPILDVRSPEEMAHVVRMLLERPSYLSQTRRASLDWSVRVSSPKAVGAYWLRALGLA
jgi:hypothetical protein